jgi:hypothetical protein
VFELNPAAINWPRAVVVLDVMLVPLVVFWAIGHEEYLLSAIFGVVFTALADPGGSYRHRASHSAIFGLIGAGLAALGFGIGGEAWGWLVLAAFAVTLVAGLAVMFGVHRFVTAYLLNAWFIIALCLAASFHHNAHITSHTWAQVLAWAGGSALWIALSFAGWLIRGRHDQPAPFPEMPGDTSRRKLTAPLIMFAPIRAIAIAVTFALAFGLNLSHGDWMPIAAIVAIKASLDESTITAAQRLAGALIGAAAAALVLLIPASEHGLRLFRGRPRTRSGCTRPADAGGGDSLLQLRAVLRDHRRSSADPDGPSPPLRLCRGGRPGAVDVVRRRNRSAHHAPRRAAGQAQRQSVATTNRSAGLNWTRVAYTAAAAPGAFHASELLRPRPIGS